MKFGGTSTQDAAAVANVVRIVQARRDRRPVVVISAIAQATNTLERAGTLAASGRKEEALEFLVRLLERHRAMIDALIRDRSRHAALVDELERAGGELQDLVRGVCILRELTPRTQDAFTCYGELLSSRIVAAALQESGTQATWLDTKDFMVTDGNFTRAHPISEEVGPRLKALAGQHLEAGTVPVTQGFIGITSGGIRTTMGRESSDYSAAIVGAALGAEEIQIWTDVDGILTADPTVVARVRKVRRLSFQEAYELSYFGAKVLHPGTMLPADERDIPIHIYNSRRPERSGTLVSRTTGSEEPVVKSIASRRKVALLTAEPLRRMGGQYLFWEQLYGILTTYGVPASLTVTSESRCAFVLDGTAPLSAIAYDLGGTARLRIEEGAGVVCLVGQNLRDSRRLLERVFRAVGDIPVKLVSFGASSASLGLVLEDEAIPGVIRAIHREFFEGVLDKNIFEDLGDGGGANAAAESHFSQSH